MQQLALACLHCLPDTLGSVMRTCMTGAAFEASDAIRGAWSPDWQGRSKLRLQPDDKDGLHFLGVQ